MKARLLTIGSVLCLALCSNVHSSSAAEGITFYMNSIVGYVNGTAGWSFTPQTPISVTSLGCFDYITTQPNGISVGLWAPNGSLLASSAVSSSSTLVNQTRYESISPIVLSPGQTYYLGAYVNGGTIVFNAVDPQQGGSITTSPGIQLGQAVAGFGSFTFPNIIAGDPGTALITANFQYVAVPEPSSLAFLLLGGVMLRWRKIR